MTSVVAVTVLLAQLGSVSLPVTLAKFVSVPIVVESTITMISVVVEPPAAR